MRYELTDHEWAAIKPMLPNKPRRSAGGSWIQLSCTGNQGRKDDPEYVAALLPHGARVDDRRETVQMTDGGRATALHYAAKAGFVKTIEVLLDHGADPDFGTPTDSPRSIGSPGRQNPSIAMRFAACSVVRPPGPCVAIGDNDTWAATNCGNS